MGMTTVAIFYFFFLWSIIKLKKCELLYLKVNNFTGLSACCANAVPKRTHLCRKYLSCVSHQYARKYRDGKFYCLESVFFFKFILWWRGVGGDVTYVSIKITSKISH
jgi:hypothetical protein